MMKWTVVSSGRGRQSCDQHDGRDRFLVIMCLLRMYVRISPVVRIYCIPISLLYICLCILCCLSYVLTCPGPGHHHYTTQTTETCTDTMG